MCLESLEYVQRVCQSIKEEVKSHHFMCPEKQCQFADCTSATIDRMIQITNPIAMSSKAHQGISKGGKLFTVIYISHSYKK